MHDDRTASIQLRLFQASADRAPDLFVWGHHRASVDARRAFLAREPVGPDQPLLTAPKAHGAALRGFVALGAWFSGWSRHEGLHGVLETCTVREHGGAYGHVRLSRWRGGALELYRIRPDGAEVFVTHVCPETQIPARLSALIARALRGPTQH